MAKNSTKHDAPSPLASEAPELTEEQRQLAALAADNGGDAFRDEEARHVDINAKWYQNEPGSVVKFVPIQRSGDVRHLFPGQDGKVSEKPKYVWACQLMGPAVLLQNQENVQGNVGDLFFLFEPSHQGIARNLHAAAANRHGLALVNHGKKPRFIKSQNAKRDVWDYSLRLVPKPFPVVHEHIALPQDDTIARLPERVKETAADTE